MNHDMGYREEDDVVVLRMTREDHAELLLVMGFATGSMAAPEFRRRIFGLVNRLEHGNTQFTPYSTAAAT